MTVAELKDLLNSLPDNAQIVFNPENSDYVEDFTESARHKMVTSMWGNDFEAFVLYGEQIGSI